MKAIRHFLISCSWVSFWVFLITGFICVIAHRFNSLFVWSTLLSPLSFGIYLGLNLIGCLDSDRRTIVKSRINLGYTREDLYELGYTKYELDCFETDENMKIPTSKKKKS
jgi:hypothetical protein